MAVCGIRSGIGFVCDDLRKPGGYYSTVYIFNKEDLRVPIDVTLETYLTDIELVTYRGMYKFTSAKYSHEATWALQRSDGGSVSFLQTVTLRLPNSTPTSDVIMEDAAVSELVVITRSNAGEYQIWGAENGLSGGDGTQGGAGRQATDSAFTTLVLTGTERYLPKRLLRGTDAATLQFLNDSSN